MQKSKIKNNFLHIYRDNARQKGLEMKKDSTRLMALILAIVLGGATVLTTVSYFIFTMASK